MLNKVSINVLLKTVILGLGIAVVVTLSLGVWNSWDRVTAARREEAVANASTYLFTALSRSVQACPRAPARPQRRRPGPSHAERACYRIPGRRR